MKKLLLTVLFISTVLTTLPQRPSNNHRRIISGPKFNSSLDTPVPGTQPENLYVSARSVLDDPYLMMTKYDLQSNYSSGQQRIYYYPDGTMGAVATMSQDDGGAWALRGTGYNYYNGSSWGTMPGNRVETTRTGWPSYQPFGDGGEIIVAHQVSPEPMKICTRPTKGTGTWTESTVPIPSGATTMWWSRMVTNGPSHNNIHIIAMTLPTGNGGTAYNGMDGALLYIRSLDGGSTWSDWQQLPGMTSGEYLSFSADTYSWAQPHGDTLAFTFGFSWYDQVLMKSTDNGTTWTKTVIYNSPYNLVGVGGSSSAFFYCPDGSAAVVLDKNGMAHVTFGLKCDSLFGSTSYYNTYWTDGIVYWNESMPTLRQDLDPDSLYAGNQLIGWVKDTMVFYQPTTAIAEYSTSLTSNPSMVIDDDNNLFVVWAGVTTLLDPDNYMLRHIFERTATIYPGNAVSWHDPINDLTSDFLYTNIECMYPDVSPNTSAEKFYVLFQADDYAGGYVKGLNVAGYAGQTGITENNMIVLSPLKSDVGVGLRGKKDLPASFEVSNNYPNPFKEVTSIEIQNKRPGNLAIEVSGLTGEKRFSLNYGNINSGSHHYVINAGQLSPGIYFYTVKLGSESITKKMVIR